MPERVLDPIPPIEDPYPDFPITLAGVEYERALALVRLKDAAAMISGGREDADYLVGADYSIRWTATDGRTGRVTVPRGMPTDLTSVPRPFRWFVGRVGPWLEAAIVHDWLCVAWGFVADAGWTEDRRRFADEVMLKAMEAAKVNMVMRWAIYGAVRLWARFASKEAPKLSFIDFDKMEYRRQFPDGVRLPGYDGTRAVTEDGGIA